MQVYKPHYLRNACLIACLCLTAWMLQTTLQLNCDVSWLMHVANRLLQGGTYANDFFEINPPLSLYVYIPPVMLAKVLGINFILAARLYIFLLSLVSLSICYSLLEKIVRQDRWLLPLLMVTLAVIFLILPSSQLGQRENIIVILTMPYLLGVSSRLQGHKLSTASAVGVGLMAGLGFALKPFFLITLFLVELYYSLRQASRYAWIRPETIAIITVITVYLVMILTYHQDYLVNMLPFAAHYFLHGYGDTYAHVLLSSLLLTFGFAGLLAIYQRQQHAYSTLTTLLLLALIGNLIAYLLQHTRLFYHLIPALSINLLLLILLFSLRAIRIDLKKKDYLIISLVCTLLIVFLMYQAPILWVILVFSPMTFYSFMAALSATLFYIAEPNKTLFRVTARTAFVIITAYLFSYFVQHDDLYANRFALTVAMLALLFCLSVPAQSTRYKLNYTLLWLFGMLLFAYPCWYSHLAYADESGYQQKYDKLIQFMKTQALHQPVYFFTASTYHAFPAVDYAGVIPAVRSQAMGWLRSLMLPEPSPAKLNPQLTPEETRNKAFLIGLVAEDLEKKQPVLVIVDTKTHQENLYGMNFDYVTFFSTDARFRKAWAAYRYETTITEPPFYQFQIYKRTTTS